MVDKTTSRRAILSLTAGVVGAGAGFTGVMYIQSRRERGEPVFPSRQDGSDGQEYEPDDTADDLGCQTTGVLGELSSSQLTTDPRAITIRGDRALVTGRGLSIVDISDETGLSEIATSSDEAVSGYGHIWLDQYAYLMDLGNSTIHVVDLSDVTNPKVVTRFSDDRLSPRKAAFRNGLLYLSSHDDVETFSIVDVTDRTDPEIVGTLTDPNLRGRCQEVALAGEFAFVTNKDNSVLQVIDIDNPRSPQTVDSVVLGQPYGMLVLDDRLLVSLTDGTNGLAVLDISEPDALTVETEYTDNPMNSVYGMEYVDGYLYGADKDACHGYHAVDIASPTDPQVTDSVKSEHLDRPYDVAINDGVAFVVSRGSQTIVAMETHHYQD